MFHDRGEFGNELTYNKQWLPGNLLLCATNINLTNSQRFAKYLYILWQCYRYKLPKSQYKIGHFLKNIILLLSNYNKIRHSRLIEKQNGTTHL